MIPYLGPYAISCADLVLEDKARKKQLPVKVSFPVEGEGHPLIVFSHGLLGSKDGYQVLVRYLVSHGYAVIAPTHSDSAFYRKPKLSELKDMTPLFVDWASRPLDMSFVLDSLDEIERLVPQFAGKCNRQRISAAGHSFGSHTSLLLAGAGLFNSAPGLDPSRFADPRFLSFLLISPQGTGLALTHEAAFSEASFAELKQPVFFITGTLDNFKRGQDYLWRSQGFHLSAGGDKHLLVIDGGCHGFGGIAGTRFPGAGPDNSEHVEWVKLSTLTFFDAYLKDCQQAEAFLKEGLGQVSPALSIAHK